jgi:hypothetical protein
MPLDKTADKEKAALLMKKYELLRAEVLMALGRYKDQVKYFQIIITALIALFTFTIGKDAYIAVAKSPMFWVFIMYVTTTGVSYVVFAVLDLIYHMVALSSRLAVLEVKINRLAGERLFIWETDVVGKFYGGKSPVKGVWHPDWFQTIYMVVLLIFGVFTLPVYVGWEFWGNSSVLVRAATGVGFAYSLGSVLVICAVAVKLVMRFRPGAQKLVWELSNKPWTGDDGI